MTMLVSVIANAMYPVGTNMEALLNSAKNYSCQLALNRISPYYLFSEAVTTIMNPSVRTIGLMTVQSLSGAIEGYLSFGQSLLLFWSASGGLTAFMLGTFCTSYILFMRQEIREKDRKNRGIGPHRIDILRNLYYSLSIFVLESNMA